MCQLRQTRAFTTDKILVETSLSYSYICAAHLYLAGFCLENPNSTGDESQLNHLGINSDLRLHPSTKSKTVYVKMALRWLIKLFLGLSGTRGLAKKHTACSLGHNFQGNSLVNVKYFMHAFDWTVHWNGPEPWNLSSGRAGPGTAVCLRQVAQRTAPPPDNSLEPEPSCPETWTPRCYTATPGRFSWEDRASRTPARRQIRLK